MISYDKVIENASKIKERIGKIEYLPYRDLSCFHNKEIIHFGSGKVEKSNHQMIKEIASKVISIDCDKDSGADYATPKNALQKETKKYDGLFSEHVIEHIPIQAVPEIFRDLRCLLNKDAEVILTIPNIYNFGAFFSNYEHVNFSPPDHIASIIELEGFPCNKIFSWSKQRHVQRHSSLSEVEFFIANFLEKEFNLQLARFVTINLTAV